jgi:hypothetical protein
MILKGMATKRLKGFRRLIRYNISLWLSKKARIMYSQCLGYKVVRCHIWSQLTKSNHLSIYQEARWMFVSNLNLSKLTLLRKLEIVTIQTLRWILSILKLSLLGSTIFKVGQFLKNTLHNKTLSWSMKINFKQFSP